LFTRGDDNTGTVPIGFNFNYFGTFYGHLYVSTNGFISFGSIVDSMNSALSANAISALNYDLDTRYIGSIYYENLNSQTSDYYSIKYDLNRLDSYFEPTNIFRITYDNVPNFGTKSYHTTSFQIILASEDVSSKSYILLKYTSCLTGLSLSAMQAIYYLGSNGQPMSYLISVNPCTSSNVNLNGTWVFDVSPLIGKLYYSVIFYFYSKSIFAHVVTK
jgi:hypothetical protein